MNLNKTPNIKKELLGSNSNDDMEAENIAEIVKTEYISDEDIAYETTRHLENNSNVKDSPQKLTIKNAYRTSLKKYKRKMSLSNDVGKKHVKLTSINLVKDVVETNNIGQDLCKNSKTKGGDDTLEIKCLENKSNTIRKIRKMRTNFKFKKSKLVYNRCAVCNKMFNFQQNLLKHVQQYHPKALKHHFGELPYSCILCSKSFNRNEHLKRHYYYVHSAVQKSNSFVKITDGAKKHIKLKSIDVENDLETNNVRQDFCKSSKDRRIKSIKLEKDSKLPKQLRRNERVFGNFFENKEETTNLQNTVDIKKQPLETTIVATRSKTKSFENNSSFVEENFIKERRVLRGRVNQKSDIKDLTNIKNESMHTRNRKISKETNSKTNMQSFEDEDETTANLNSKKTTITCNRCAVCKKTFDYQVDLVKHAQQKHPNGKAFKCRDCGDRFTEMPKLSHHFRIVHNVKKYTCKVCSKTFHIKFNYVRHLKLHAEKRPYPCSLCEKSFNRQDHWRIHQKWHLKQKSNDTKKSTAPVSQKSNGSQTSNKAMKTNASGTKKVAKQKNICKVCSKSFHKAFHLSRHLTSHSEDRPFSCSLCEKNYKRQDQLKIHQKWHLKQKTNDNNKSTTNVIAKNDGCRTSNKRMKPDTIETEERPYSCSQCDKSYKRQKDLKRHENKHLETKKPSLINNKCSICNKVFKFQKDQPIKCPDCEAITERSYSCSLCEKSFTLEHHLKAHLQAHLNKVATKNM